jgi:hypothetical protein
MCFAVEKNRERKSKIRRERKIEEIETGGVEIRDTSTNTTKRPIGGKKNKRSRNRQELHEVARAPIR